MKRESKSFTDSLYAILSAAGMFAGPKYMLSGLSGMSFKFTVHRLLLPMSVTAYGQWGTEHRPAIDNLGVFTEWDGGRTRHPTFSYYREEAIKATKRSLDQGLGAVYWLPEFGVIRGYDDEDGVFFIQDGFSAEDRVVLYDNFGLNRTEFWACQWFGGQVRVDMAEQVLESLRLAVYDWETPHKTLPDTEIASGRLAYPFLMQGLTRGDYDEAGSVYILRSYVCSRTEIAHYLREVHEILPGLAEAADLYEKLGAFLPGIEGCMTVTKGASRVDRAKSKELCALLAEAQSLEERAVARFRRVSAEYPDLKRTTLPRWGAHIPR